MPLAAAFAGDLTGCAVSHGSDRIALRRCSLRVSKHFAEQIEGPAISHGDRREPVAQVMDPDILETRWALVG